MGKNFLHIETAFRAVMLVLMLCGVGITKGFAYDFSATYGGKTLYYNIIDANNHYVELTYPGTQGYDSWDGYTKPTGNLSLPSNVSYNNTTYSVNRIGWYAFSGCTGLTGINLSSSITSIGGSAFFRCNGLTGTLVIGNNVSTIYGQAFQGCSNITEVVIGENVTIIGDHAFHGCTSMTELTIGTGVTEIDIAFWDCPSLTTVHFNATNCSIMGYCGEDDDLEDAIPVFSSAYNWSTPNITTVTIGDNVTKIPDFAFKDCSNITGEILIPNSVTTIGGCAFYNCAGLTSFTLGTSLNTIYSWAFRNCSNVSSISIFDTTPADVYSDAFSGIGTGIPVYVPCGTTQIYSNGSSLQWYWRRFTNYQEQNWNNLVVSSNDNYKGTAEITQAATCSDNAIVTAIPNAGAFLNWTEGGEVVSTDNPYSFELTSDRNLVANFVPVEIIDGDYKYTVDLVTGEASVKANNTSVTSSLFATSVEYLGFDYPVTSIAQSGFKNCTNISEMIMPNSIITVGSGAFSGCDFTKVVIPASVTQIRQQAFFNCSLLTEVVFEDGPELITLYNNKYSDGIGGGLFENCPVEKAYIGRNIAVSNYNDSYNRPWTNAPFSRWWDSTYAPLSEVTIASCVTQLCDYFFEKCNAIEFIVSEIESPDNMTIGTGVFRYVDKTIPIYVPCGSVASYQNTTGWNEFTNYQSEGDCPIVFADANVKAICVENWDANDDGELSYAEAAAVTDLGEVFKNNTTITSFDELQYFTGLTTIGWEAFAWCHNLTSIVLPSSITSIDGGAFNDCRNLLSITIPAAVTEIGFAALTCDNLETIIVEQGNTVYDSRDNCNAVIITSSNELIRGCKNTVIPNTVVSLYDHAFASCSMESINIPASVTNISTSAFYLCGNLATITVDANNVVYDSRNNSNAIIQTNTNKLVAGSKTTVIPNTVTVIGEYAFSNRFSIGSFSVTIPESVTLIEQNAYLGGYGIESISVLADIPPTLQSYAFAYVGKTIPVNVPCGTRSAYQAAEGWSEFTNITVDPECGRQITASVNPANTGSVTGAGSYDVGDICTLTATPESGYRFVNWTENNEVVSTNATYQFTVNANRDLVANFEEYVLTNHYVCDISQFADYMPVVAVVVIDGVEQGSETLEIGAFSGDECRGSKFAAYFTPTQHYIYQLPVYGEGGDAITFKLYNHDIQQELDITCTVELQWQKSGYGGLSNPYEITFVSSVNISATVNPANAGTITGAGTYMPGETATLAATANGGYAFANWTEGGNVVSQNATYSFTVTTARELVANFNTVQSNTLSAGWNWYSTYIEQTGIDGLSMLEEGLGEHGELIMSRTGAMVENFEGSFWWGDLNAVTNEEMYEIKTNAQTNVVMTGGKATPSSHPITVAPGWNWIGYVSNTSNSIDNALSSLASNEDDIIQSRNAFSSYFPGYGWYGDLENMTPGQGYMYKSNGTVSQTLVYPTASRSNESEAVAYHNQADYNRYRNVMDVMAKVIINGEPANSNRYELAAFVNGECRGGAKLQYVEPMDTYLAFITINGNDDETVTFNLYDEDMDVTYYASESNVVAFKANEVIGRFRTPYILCFNNAENVENTVFTVYPNPAANGEEITISFMEDVTEATLFVENELGLTVDVVKLSGKSAKVRLDLPSGLYILRVVIDGNIYYNKLIVK